MPSIVKIIPLNELESMHTGSLMARRKALLKCEASLSASDRDSGYKVAPGTIEFKDSEEWKLAYRQLKNVLSKRENWPIKGDKKAARRSHNNEY
jgi:hypothetical protein